MRNLTQRLYKNHTWLSLAVSLPLVAACAVEEDRSPDWEAYDFSAVLAPEEVDPSATFDCDVLDHGIYWFGYGNQSEKHVPGVVNPFFAADRPTVLFAHGWQRNSSRNRKRETFNYLQNDPKHGVDVDMADAWIDAGWNIGIFYWNQFADEPEVKHAEAKIWTTTGPRDMRWRQCDGSFTDAGSPSVSVGELFYDAYAAAMADYTGTNIRLVGHSLGNQVVTRLADLVRDGIARGDLSGHLLPTRVALMDPFWSKGKKDYLDDQWTGEAARADIADLVADGVIFERYKSSNMNDWFIGDKNRPLTDMIGETELIPAYIPALDQGGRHVAAAAMYFRSFAFPPPPGCDSVCNEQAASASTSDERTRELMEEASRWKQLAGESTESPADNQFKRR